MTTKQLIESWTGESHHLVAKMRAEAGKTQLPASPAPAPSQAVAPAPASANDSNPSPEDPKEP